MALLNINQNVQSYNGANNAYTFRLEVIQNSQNTANNTTNITINHYADPNSDWGYNNFSTPKSYIYLNGVLKKETAVSSLPPYASETLIGTWTGDVTHDDTGYYTGTVKAVYNPNTTAYSYVPKTNTLQGDITPTTIPRGSTLSFTSSAYMNSSLSITVTQQSASFSHILYYKTSIGVYTEIGRYTATKTYTWTIADIASSLPNTDRDIYTIRCVTYFNQSYSGDSLTTDKPLTALVPAAYLPSVSISVEEGNTSIPSGYPYLTGVSKLKVTTVFTGSHNSTCRSRTVSVPNNTNQTSTSSNSSVTMTFNEPITDNNTTVSATVRDSRDRQAGATTTVSATSYTPPQLDIDCTRCDSSGNIDPLGTYVKVMGKWSATPILVNGTNQNSYTIVVTFYGDTTSFTTYNGTASVNNWTLLHKFSSLRTTNEGTVTATIKDTVTTTPVPTTKTISKASMPLALYKDSNGIGVTFGRLATEEDARMYMDLHLYEGFKIVIHKSDNTTETHDVTDLFT